MFNLVKIGGTLMSIYGMASGHWKCKFKNEKWKKKGGNNKHPLCKDFIEFNSYGSSVCFVVNVAIGLGISFNLLLKLNYKSS